MSLTAPLTTQSEIPPEPAHVLPVIMLTRGDGRLVGETLLTLIAVGEILKRPMKFFIRGGLGHAIYFNAVMAEIFNVYHLKTFRALYVEDDNLIQNNQAHFLARMIKEADEKGYNITANYKLADGRNVYHHGDGTPYQDLEIEMLKPFDPVELTGMGFFYGSFDVEYRFHEGDVSSVDWTFYLERQIELRHIPLKVGHIKTVYF
jgi:hypothetical protein